MEKRFRVKPIKSKHRLNGNRVPEVDVYTAYLINT